MAETVTTGNLFQTVARHLPEEEVGVLLETPGLRLERIVSTGHATPPGAWYDQPQPEWVVLLAGGAGLLIEGEADARRLAPGDWMLIPAGVRHRVAWTDPDQPTVWLALHYRS